MILQVHLQHKRLLFLEFLFTMLQVVRFVLKSCSAKVAFNPRGSGKPIKYQRGSNLIYNQGTFENLYGSNSKYGSDSIYGLDERTADKLYGSALLPQNLDGSFYPQQPELNCPAQINEEIVNGAALYSLEFPNRDTGEIDFRVGETKHLGRRVYDHLYSLEKRTNAATHMQPFYDRLQEQYKEPEYQSTRGEVNPRGVIHKTYPDDNMEERMQDEKALKARFASIPGINVLNPENY